MKYGLRYRRKDDDDKDTWIYAVWIDGRERVWESGNWKEYYSKAIPLNQPLVMFDTSDIKLVYGMALSPDSDFVDEMFPITNRNQARLV